MKLLKNKKIYMVILFIIGIVFSIIAILEIYVRSNHDIKIITDKGGSFFIFSSEEKNYYLLNTSLGKKVETKQFEENNKITDEQMEYVKKIRDLDNRFILKDNSFSNRYIFFCDDYIFYTHYAGYYNPDWSDEYKEDVLYYFYKYNIKTNDIEKLKISEDNSIHSSNLKLESLLHLYPKLEDSLNDIAQNIIDWYDISLAESFRRVFGDIYYGNGRIVFDLYYSSMNKGDNHYLYEYDPSTNSTKMITKLKENVIYVEILK